MGITQEIATQKAEADTRSFYTHLYNRLNAHQLTRAALDGATGDMAAQFATDGPVSEVVAGQDALAVRQAALTFIALTFGVRPDVEDDGIRALVDLEPAARLRFVEELVTEYGGVVPETVSADA